MLLRDGYLVNEVIGGIAPDKLTRKSRRGRRPQMIYAHLKELALLLLMN